MNQLQLDEPVAESPADTALVEHVASLERIVAANPNYYLVRCVVVAAVVGKSREDAGRRLADIAGRSGFCVEKVL